jgi:hypothetical protein
MKHVQHLLRYYLLAMYFRSCLGSVGVVLMVGQANL